MFFSLKSQKDMNYLYFIGSLDNVPTSRNAFIDYTNLQGANVRAKPRQGPIAFAAIFGADNFANANTA